jgi:phosphomannomutase/phosphoglucomutase
MGFFLVALAVVALGVVLAWYAGERVRDAQQRQSRLERAEAVARLVASGLGSGLDQVRRTLLASAGDAEAQRLLQGYSAERARAWGRTVGRRLPGALAVNLLPSGWDDVAGLDSPYLGFAALDLVRQAEREGKPSAFEVHQAGGQGQYVSVAVPVRIDGDEKVLGTVHAALSVEWLAQAMDAVPGSLGTRLALRQRLPNGGSRILSGPDAASDGAVAVAGSIWEVAYRVDDEGSISMGSVGSWSAPMVTLAFAVLGLVWQGRRLARALRQDQASLAAFVDALAHGRPPSRPTLRLAESETLLSQLEGRGAMLASKAAATPAGTQEVSETQTQVVSYGEAAPRHTEAAGKTASAAAVSPIPPGLFTGYDIRGVAGETLTVAVVELLGKAIGSEAYERGQQAVVIGRDARTSSVELAEALARGLRQSGRDVIDLGLVPTPMVYFATSFLGTDSGVMVTGSHNPAEYNGLKVVVGGEVLAGESLRSLAKRVEQGELLEGSGSYREQPLLPDYVGRVTSDVRIARPMKVVVDCGNGAAGEGIQTLLRTLGCDVVPLYCEPDGSFPNHHPDPSRPENLEDLVAAVQSEAADLGLAYDGDGDRLGVVDNAGKIIWPDRLLMLFAQDVLSRQPGADILYDVKSTRDLASHILLHGGRPLMWKSGHSLMRAKLKEAGALLGGELSGHFFFEERWYGFDDALYASARLLEILAEDSRSSAEVFAELPESLATPEIQVPIDDGAQHKLVAKIINQAELSGATLVTIDGLRAEFADGWGLVRASNTMPCLVFRFEANDPESLAVVQSRFRELVHAVDPDLSLPF